MPDKGLSREDLPQVDQLRGQKKFSRPAIVDRVASAGLLGRIVAKTPCSH